MDLAARADEGYAMSWAVTHYSPESQGFLGRFSFGPSRDKIPSFLMGHKTAVFATKREAQAAIREHYGYIAKRKDLRKAPHNWRVPKPVKVDVIVKAAYR